MARARADASFPAESDGSFSRADGTFFQGAGPSFAQGALYVFRGYVESANIIEPAVVGFTDERINAKNVLVFRLGQRPTGYGCRGVPDAQRVGENDGRFNLAELVYLRGSDEFSKRVVDVNGACHFVLKNVSCVRQDCRNARPDVFTFNESDLADLDASHIGDRVVGSGLVDAGMDAKLARSRAMFLRCSLCRQNRRQCNKSEGE